MANDAGSCRIGIKFGCQDFLKTFCALDLEVQAFFDMNDFGEFT